VDGDEPKYTEVPIAELGERCKALLDAQVKSLGYYAPETKVVIGDHPADDLVAACTDIGGDLLVVPARGKGAVQRILLGSTTERILKRAIMPVLVLPPKALGMGSPP
jgi:nucleotide-binding universal stress UspA family protein